MPQQADSFIINATVKFQILPLVDRKRFLLSHCQTIYDCSWFLPSSRASEIFTCNFCLILVLVTPQTETSAIFIFNLQPRIASGVTRITCK